MSNLFLCRKEHARVPQARQNYPGQLAVRVMRASCSLLQSARSHARMLFLATLFCCLGLGSVAFGQTNTNIWISGNGTWETAGNWSNGLPTSTSFVIFSNSVSGASYAVGL